MNYPISIKGFISSGDRYYSVEEFGYMKLENEFYIYGYIDIEIYGHAFIGEPEYDLVDQLWMYFINSLIKVKKNKKSHFYFPDQPLKIELKLFGNKLYMNYPHKKRSVSCDFAEFAKIILLEAKTFYIELSRSLGNRMGSDVEIENEFVKLRHELIGAN